ncbi:NPCBM/NEW2 domain-containing protein [Roseimaritima ulvae]|uniref:NPCBM/NEW2 domain protein n=1 Tax=Roseimaritima ulvae TaxID=980254 RepID=A0A5B9QV10_9BACT|nr:NPCBM/NEW2 domain-containing protein [Roseimaritima ulvae]QEG41630.1 NPCBM/NEW2 domain protein [Roseimaritima ulvae]
MQLLFFCAAWMLTGGLSVNVTPIDGSTYPAELVGAQNDALMLHVDGQPQQVPLGELQSVSRSEPDERVGPAVRATLRDGTRLPVDDIEMDATEAKLKLRRQGVFSVPVRDLQVLRFRSPSAQVDAQWAAYVEAPKSSDQLVIRRGTDTLDAVEGLVKGISEQSVQFELGGAPVDAPFNRLEGIVFAGQDSDAAAGKLRIKDVYGAIWNAESLSAGADDKTLTVHTTGGLQHAVRIDLIESIELSSGILFLTEVEPLEQTYQPFIVSPQSVPEDRVAQWMGPRVQDQHTLVVSSRSTIRYRIEPGFSRFAAEVQIDPSVTLGGQCELRVRLNDQTAWEKTLKIGEPLQQLDVPVGAASQLTLEVDYGDDGDIGDIVHIREPRFLK